MSLLKLRHVEPDKALNGNKVCQCETGGKGRAQARAPNYPRLSDMPHSQTAHFPSLCLLLSPTFPQDTFIFYLNKAKSHLCAYKYNSGCPSPQAASTGLVTTLSIAPTPALIPKGVPCVPSIEALVVKKCQQTGMAKVSTASRDGEDRKGGSPQRSSTLQDYSRHRSPWFFFMASSQLLFYIFLKRHL